MQKRDVEKLLRLMGKNYESNYSSLTDKFRRKGVSSRNYLFVLTDELYDEKQCELAIKSILFFSGNPNYKEDYGYNFIQNALYAGYSTKFIVDLINYCGSLKNKLNVNHQDDDGDTMLHTAIYADDFKGDIAEIYAALIKQGFNSNLVDKSHRGIVDAMVYEQRTHNKFSNSEIEKVRKIYSNQKDEQMEKKQNAPIDKVLEKMGYDLSYNDKVLKKELNGMGRLQREYLYLLTDDFHNELCCFAAVKSLLKSGACSPNELVDDYNFIQNAMYAGYGTAFINGCIDAAMDSFLKEKLNINHRDGDGDTMLHTAIYCNDECVIDIASVYKTLLKYGFDSKLIEKKGMNIIDAMKYEQNRCNKFSDEQIKRVEELYVKVLGTDARSFSHDEKDKHQRLDNEGLNNFLKNCRG